MNTTDSVTFNQAVATANTGDKRAANNQLKILLSANPTDVNLLLWTAFTSDDLNHAGDLIDRASAIEPGNPALAQAKGWLTQERAKQPPLPPPPIPMPPTTPPPFGVMPTSPLPPIHQAAMPPAPGPGFNYAYQQQPYGQPQPLPYYPNPIGLNPIQPLAGSNSKVVWSRVVYGIAAVGVALLAISVFLPWMELEVNGYKVSMNGLGSLSGSSLLIGAINKEYGSTGLKDGVLVLIGVFPLILLTIGGFLQHKKRFAIPMLVLGLAGLGINILDSIDITGRANVVSSDTALVGASSGFGLVLGIIGALVVMVGAIAALIVGKPLSNFQTTNGNGNGNNAAKALGIASLIVLGVIALIAVVGLVLILSGPKIDSVFNSVTKGLS